MTTLTRRRFLGLGAAAVAGAAALRLVPLAAPQARANARTMAGRPILFSPGLGGPFLTVDPDTGATGSLGNAGVEPAWAPARGGYVYASWDDAPEGIYLVGPGEEGRGTRLVDGKEYLQPLLSPDGNQLTWLNRDTTLIRLGRELVPDPLTGINVIGILGNPGYAPGGGTQDSFGPGWAPDGRTFLWSGEGGLFTSPVGPEFPNPQTLRMHGTDSRWAMPRWSPDGRTILFMYRMHDRWELASVRPDGQGFRLLTNTLPLRPTFTKISPAWSPDGSRIAYLSNNPGRGETFYLWMANADGSGQRQVSDVPVHADYIFTRLVSWA